jgi:hypothetical protein
MTTRCVNKLQHQILLNGVSLEEANAYIRDHCTEWYEIPPGFIIRDVRILGDAPMLLGTNAEMNKILIPFNKRCVGIQLLELTPCDEWEFDRIRADIRALSGE